jgi:hypothetical protein
LNKIVGRLKFIWNERQNFTFLLIVLSLYIFVIIPIVKGLFLGELLFFTFYFLLLSSGIPFMIKHKRREILILLSIAPFILLISQFAFQKVWLALSANMLMELYCISLGTIILMKTFSKGHVTIHRVQGGIIVYLLVSLIFALLFHSISLLYGKMAFTGLVTYQRTEFMYFSLSTITTVAFGDIAPVNPFARSLSNLEGLTGQLYPAILIARLVSMGFTNPGNNL